MGKVIGTVGNILTDGISGVSYGVHKGAGKVMKEGISYVSAQRIGVGVVGGAAIGATTGLVTNVDEGLGSAAGGTIKGAGLGAVGGGAAGVAYAIAKGIR